MILFCETLVKCIFMMWWNVVDVIWATGLLGIKMEYICLDDHLMVWLLDWLLECVVWVANDKEQLENAVVVVIVIVVYLRSSYSSLPFFTSPAWKAAIADTRCSLEAAEELPLLLRVVVLSPGASNASRKGLVAAYCTRYVPRVW